MGAKEYEKRVEELQHNRKTFQIRKCFRTHPYSSRFLLSVSCGPFFNLFFFLISMHACSVLNLCLTLCNPEDHSPLCSSVYGIFTAKLLEWVAMPSSRVFSHSGFKTMSPEFPAFAGGFFTAEPAL